MSPKPWPSGPTTPTCFDDSPGAGWNDWHMVPLEPRTCCKHGAGACETCGTTDERDYKHKTWGGRGLVAHIPRRRT